jgi:hypothetical protein
VTTTWNAGALGRLFALGLAGGILQLTTVSQITVLGVPADLAPLLAAAVGLLLGSIPGACFGCGLGLLMDTAHALVPVAVGAAATALAALGFTVMQFLLGVDAPVSVLLVRQVVLTIVLNTLLALPVYLVCRRVLAPLLPDDPRRRRRRAYTTGGLSPLTRA